MSHTLMGQIEGLFSRRNTLLFTGLIVGIAIGVCWAYKPQPEIIVIAAKPSEPTEPKEPCTPSPVA